MVTVVQVLHPVCIGVDVGQSVDPTAVCVTEVSQFHTGKYRDCERIPPHVGPDGQFVGPKDAEPVMRSKYTVRSIRRLPLGTSYPDVAAYLADLLCNPLFARRSVRLLIDATGVGRPVYEDLCKEVRLRKEARHVQIKPITFVPGENYNRRKGTLGKSYLVSRLQSLLQSTRVEAPDTEEVKDTLDELRVYKRKTNDNGNDIYGAITGKHDDLATALALSVLEDPYGERVGYTQRVY